MSSIQDIMQNYFNPYTVIHHLPSKDDMLSFEKLVVRLPYNEFIDPEYIRFIFEITLQFGIIEKIDQVLNVWNDSSSQIVYIIKFSQIFRNSSSYANACYNLLNWGYYDMCIIYPDNVLTSTVRVFYDKMIGNVEGKNVDDIIETTVSENNNIIIESLKQMKNDIQQNYEQFESIVESDIDHVDNKTNVLCKELEDTKKELNETKRVLDDLKDQVKWIHKLFCQKVKFLESDLRDDFKEFVENELTNNKNKNKSSYRR